MRSSSRSSFNIFGDRPNRHGVYTAPKCGTKTYPIRDAPLSRSAWCSFPLVTEISTPQLSFMCAWTEALSGMILVARAKAVWIVTLHSSMASTCTTERLLQIAHLIKCRRTVRGLRVQFLRKICKFRSSRELLSGFVSTSIKREIRHVHVVVLRWRQRNEQKVVVLLIYSPIHTKRSGHWNSIMARIRMDWVLARGMAKSCKKIFGFQNILNSLNLLLLYVLVAVDRDRS